ncbi:hypothetical protein PGTUg99_033284 [Puccinia graminis f. sp. tritici]|uniref:DUF6818 domain-containing protein n=1 Tax=Puccinia graminis f. sp. tritici TaxID=56615 RepID=A0A5B0SNB8_PUCGR|nr:hypothetical protein PGTUg99_033284 [Puccinia graminis f. sp. tritici]
MTSNPNFKQHTTRSSSQAFVPGQGPIGPVSTARMEEFNISDLTVLAKAVLHFKPVGNVSEWAQVAAKYNQYANQHNRQPRSLDILLNQFRKIINDPKPSSDPGCPRYILSARSAQQAINERMSSEDYYKASASMVCGTEERDDDAMEASMEGNSIRRKEVGVGNAPAVETQSALGSGLTHSNLPKAQIRAVPDNLMNVKTASERADLGRSSWHLETNDLRLFDAGAMANGNYIFFDPSARDSPVDIIINQGPSAPVNQDPPKPSGPSSSLAQAPEAHNHSQRLSTEMRKEKGVERSQRIVQRNPQLDQQALETLILNSPRPQGPAVDESMNGETSRENPADHSSTSLDPYELLAEAKSTINSLNTKLTRSKEVQDQLRQVSSRLQKQVCQMDEEKKRMMTRFAQLTAAENNQFKANLSKFQQEIRQQILELKIKSDKNSLELLEFRLSLSQTTDTPAHGPTSNGTQ